MINIDVQLPRKVSLSERFSEAANAALVALGEMAKDRIGQEAAHKLRSSYAQYLYGLQQPGSFEAKPGMVTVRLLGKMPGMLETGFDSFDMKPGLIGGSAAQRKMALSKSGRGVPYVDVPFRHGLPGSTRFQPMPKSVAASMASAVRQAKAAGRSTQRLQLTQRTKGTGTHKVGLWDQMTRIEKTYSKATQAKYMTFRRVSAKSLPQAWIHPGFAGIRAFDKVARDIEQVAPQVVAEYIRNARWGR